jgi:hypothetical protein
MLNSPVVFRKDIVFAKREAHPVLGQEKPAGHRSLDFHT